jgi:hypothetical protein
MMTEHEILQRSAGAIAKRESWARPVVRRLDAGSAEIDLDTTFDGVLETDS